jgi:glycine/serine hydroxymethyltransferase
VQPGNVPLVEHDPELHDIIEKEKNRQWKSLELIASEVRRGGRVISRAHGPGQLIRMSRGEGARSLFEGNSVVN